MTDRAQPGAIDSLIRNDELAQVFGRFSEGFIVPGSDPTPAAQRRGDIDETALDAFSLTASTTSLDVTVAPGEAFVSGWVCRDVDTTLALPANSTVDIVVGFDPDAIFNPSVDPDRDAADETVVDLDANVDPTTPTTVAHRVTTDGSGVTSSERIADVGSSIQAASISGTDISSDSLSTTTLSATSLSSGTLTDEITETQLDTSNGTFDFGTTDVDAGAITGTDISSDSLSTTTLSATSLSSGTLADEITETQLDTSNGTFDFGTTDVDAGAITGTDITSDSLSTTTLSATSLSSGTLTDEITETQLDTSNGTFDFGSNDLRISTGQDIEDGSGTNRLEFPSNSTVLNNESGNRALDASNGGSVRLHARGGEPIRFRDREGEFTAVEYRTSASSPGTLELANADLNVNSNVMTQVGGVNDMFIDHSNSVPNIGSNGGTVTATFQTTSGFLTEFLFEINFCTGKKFKIETIAKKWNIRVRQTNTEIELASVNTDFQEGPGSGNVKISDVSQVSNDNISITIKNNTSDTFTKTAISFRSTGSSQIRGVISDWS